MRDAKYKDLESGNSGATSGGATPEMLRDIITRLRSGALNLDTLIQEIEPIASSEKTPEANSDFGEIEPDTNS